VFRAISIEKINKDVIVNSNCWRKLDDKTMCRSYNIFFNVRKYYFNQHYDRSHDGIYFINHRKYIGEEVKEMRKLNILRNYVGPAFAFTALIVAQIASTQFSLIYYQDTIPEKVKELKKQGE